MTTEYHKINSIYKRNMESKRKDFILDQYAQPEFETLKNAQWLWKDKIDGTNIRITWDGTSVKFDGRTDNAQIPAKLFQHLVETFTADKLGNVFTGPVVMYGEGYGAGIQSGHAYSDKQEFVGFDIAATGEGKFTFLDWDNVQQIYKALGVPTVAVIGTGTLVEAQELVVKGFKSAIGTADSEGLILIPTTELRDRRGNRIIAKLKTRDFAFLSQPVGE